ncbi:hypothetical protein M8J75_012120 [Diaphorina citri]|nr:hypothetical protein M8J75_012120 [Diaphorina citri]
MKGNSLATSTRILYFSTIVVILRFKTKAKTIPGYNFPDFTLDTHQAEKLMSKIQATKRQRCWCRMATCLFGLLFLLLSVMAVSMFLTRGQRMFGSL